MRWQTKILHHLLFECCIVQKKKWKKYTFSIDGKWNELGRAPYVATLISDSAMTDRSKTLGFSKTMVNYFTVNLNHRTHCKLGVSLSVPNRPIRSFLRFSYYPYSRVKHIYFHNYMRMTYTFCHTVKLYEAMKSPLKHWTTVMTNHR